MNNLIKQVTPLTRAIIWILKDECDPSHAHYTEVDYLLDGILTANLKASKELSSRVLVGKNFDRPLYVMLIKEMKQSELQSFITLISTDLGPENNILVIDETNNFEKMKPMMKSVSANIQLLN